jgi:hypothetical protein
MQELFQKLPFEKHLQKLQEFWAVIGEKHLTFG